MLIAGNLSLVQYAKTHPEWTEMVYSRKIYPVIASILQALHRLFPFSIAEFLLAFLVMFLASYLLRGLQSHRKIYDPSISMGSWLVDLASKAVFAVAVIAFSFQVVWGLNYYRFSLADNLKLTVEETTAEELRAVLEHLIQETNTLRESMKETPDGSMTLSGSLTNYFIKAPQWYQTGLFYETFPLLSLNSAVKPVILSGLMSYTQITGFYFPFTGEANVNINVPDYQILSTMVHEVAHRHGFAREDEANFMAWLICHQPYISLEAQYSGNMMALSYGFNAFYRAAPKEYQELYAQLDPSVKRDFTHGSSFWKQYEGPAKQISKEVNNLFLQSNDQADGVQSYGRMVDLLIAYYRVMPPLT